MIPLDPSPEPEKIMQGTVSSRETANDSVAPVALATGIALSVQQPWAWLIVNGYKPVENRDWYTRYRGQMWIHAGKTFDAEGYSWVRRTFPEIPLPAPAEFARGGLVGRATLADCVDVHDSPWFFGRYGFVMTGASPCELVPYRGQLGFFGVNA